MTEVEQESDGRLAGLRRSLFGDGLGEALFAGLLFVFGVYWAVGVFITDTYTVANTLVGVADGHLYVDRIEYGPESAVTPGMNVVDGRLYGRNYGTVFAALPVLYVLRAVGAVADLRLVLVGLWAATALWTGVAAGRALGRRRLGDRVGAAVALLAFGVNLPFAADFDPSTLALVSLQMATMVAAALVGVLLYRLLTRTYDRRTGFAAGVAGALCTPVGFWASIPKRHAFVAALVLATLYCFHRSREGMDEGGAPDARFRAGAYAVVALTTTVHAAIALLLCCSLLVADVGTHREVDRRTVVTVGGAFLLALGPFLVLNTAISGNPIRPPRMLPRFDGELATGGGAVVGDSGSHVSLATLLLGQLESIVRRLVGYLVRSLGVFVDPGRLYEIFVRGGYNAELAAEDGGEAVRLSVLESMPLLAGLAAVPSLLGEWRRGRTLRFTPTDLLAGTYTLLLCLLYLQALPLHAMVTVRYLASVMPLAVYALARLSVVRRCLDHGWTLGLSYLGTVLVGGQLFVLTSVASGMSVGESVQLHALVNLVGAGVLAMWVLSARMRGDDWTRVGAVGLGVCGGLTTAFVLVSRVLYFPFGELAIPVVQAFSSLL